MPEPYLIRERTDQPGEWSVWIRPLTGLPRPVCAAWHRRSLRTAPYKFLARTPWPKTKGQADKVAQALIVYLRDEAEEEAPRGGPTVEDYAALFTSAKTSPRARKLAAKGKPYSPNTIANYKDIIERYIVPAPDLGPMRMGEVTTGDLEEFFAGLQKEKGSSRTLQDTWQILHMIFKQWSDDNKAPSPFQGLDKPSYQAQVRGALSEVELRAIFAAAWPSPQERAICALAFWAGLRRSEIFALQWSDVDFKGKRITVSRALKQFGRGEESEGGTKGRKARIVPLVEDAAEALKALPRLGDRVILRPDKAEPGPRDWRTAMEGAFRRAKIDTKGRNVTPHSSRHSIGSILLSRGVPKDYIRQILGHFDESTTDGYLHMAAAEIDKMAAKMDKAPRKPRHAHKPPRG